MADAETILAIIAKHRSRKGALLPLLHEIQNEFGYVPQQSVALIAEALNLSRAEVHGTISFYHDFRREPPTKPVIKLCRAEACQARGVEGIAALFEKDDRIEVETVYCLGLCAIGPNAMVGDQPHARLDDDKVRQLIEQAVRT